MSMLRSHNDKTRDGLVCATEMYRFIEHVKFPKFQTGIFVEWKAPFEFISFKEQYPVTAHAPNFDFRTAFLESKDARGVREP